MENDALSWSQLSFMEVIACAGRIKSLVEY